VCILLRTITITKTNTVMSHVKNMQSFEKLMGICTGLGGNYNPGKQNLERLFTHNVKL